VGAGFASLPLCLPRVSWRRRRRGGGRSSEEHTWMNSFSFFKLNGDLLAAQEQSNRVYVTVVTAGCGEKRNQREK